MKERKRQRQSFAPRYRKPRKKDKGIFLGEFIELTGYGRRYASSVLRSHGKKVRINEKKVLVGDVRRRVRAKRSRMYDDTVLEVLKEIWYIMDCIRGKRLAPVLREVVGRLQRYREIRVDPEVKRKLQKISPATIQSFAGSCSAHLVCKIFFQYTLDFYQQLTTIED